MEDFLINAFVISILLSLICGPIGCIILWNRLAFLGDSIAHASILGIIISVVMNINIFIGSIIVTIIILLLFINYHSDKHRIETIIFIFSYTCFSLALIINSLSTTHNINLEAMLFGDILTVAKSELIVSGLAVLIVSLWIIKNWRNILLVTIDEDIAITRGINAKSLKTKITFVIVITILFFVKIVGALLITSLLIIPASSARFLSKSPEKMVFYSIFFASLSTIIGLACSCILDTASGASIVFISSIIFIILSLTKKYYVTDKF